MQKPSRVLTTFRFSRRSNLRTFETAGGETAISCRDTSRCLLRICTARRRSTLTYLRATIQITRRPPRFEGPKALIKSYRALMGESQRIVDPLTSAQHRMSSCLGARHRMPPYAIVGTLCSSIVSLSRRDRFCHAPPIFTLPD